MGVVAELGFWCRLTVSKSGAFSGPDTVAEVKAGEPERLASIIRRAVWRRGLGLGGEGRSWSPEACGLWCAESSTGTVGAARKACAFVGGPGAGCAADGVRKRLRSVALWELWAGFVVGVGP